MSILGKSIAKGFFEEGLNRSKMADDAADTMTQMAIDNINEARKIQAERESDKKAREQKAKSLGFITDPDEAAGFLNNFDPNNTLNILELEKIYRQVEITKGDQLEKPITPGIPGSGSILPPDVREGMFAGYKKPTTLDAYNLAENKLGLKRGEGSGLFTSATQSYNPNRLQQEYSYGFQMRGETGPGTINTESLLDENFAARHGGEIDSSGLLTFSPIVTLQGGKDSTSTLDIANDKYFGKFKDSASKITRFRSDKYGFAENAMETQDNQNISGNIGEFIAAISTGSSYLDDPNDSKFFMDADGSVKTDKFNFLFKGDQTGGTKKFFETASTGVLPYEQILDVLIQNGDTDAQTVPKDFFLNAATPRPQYSLAQLEAIELDNTLTEKDFMFDYTEFVINKDGKRVETEPKRITLEQAQQEWDKKDLAKRNILTSLIGPEATTNLVAGVYGSGDYRNVGSSFNDLSDGLAGRYYDYNSMGDLENSRSRLKSVLMETLNENYSGYSDETREMILRNVDRTQTTMFDTLKSLTTKKLLEGYTGKATLKYKDGSTETGRSLIPMEYEIQEGDLDALKKRPGYSTIRHYRWIDIETGEIFDSEYNQIY